MGNQCNQWGCTNNELTDSSGNKLRGGFCSQHGYYNATYNIWVASENLSDHYLKLSAEIKDSPKKAPPKLSYIKCTMCSEPTYQSGLCYTHFNTQMHCKRMGISGMFKQY